CVLLQLRVEHEAVVVVEPAPARVRAIRVLRRDRDRAPRAAETGAERRLRMPVGGTAGRRATRRPACERRQLRVGQPARVAGHENADGERRAEREQEHVPHRATVRAKSSVRMTPFGGARVYLAAMRRRLQRADVIAAAVLMTLAGSVGTGLGLAAANVRAKN